MLPPRPFNGATQPTPALGDLLVAGPYGAPAAIEAEARLLVHYMPSVAGEMTLASTLLFVPHQSPPAGGWPVVGWVHGTTTAGQKRCAPSLSATLDGGLTPDGFVTRYVWVIQMLVAAGYAVVAPDLEGLGAVATVSQPYLMPPAWPAPCWPGCGLRATPSHACRPGGRPWATPTAGTAYSTPKLTRPKRPSWPSWGRWRLPRSRR
ncbi:hypothetical protein [Hymenobacter coccineus]|uniref:hypothetical protein n=1 Tax=Hymenobacter coccineus TaxID=1908235 RepID=UPI000F7B0FA4|nr:hypothetical protein [Hymenobacter coccineus]